MTPSSSGIGIEGGTSLTKSYGTIAAQHTWHIEKVVLVAFA